MEPSHPPVSESTLGEWAARGLAFLREQLGEAAPPSLSYPVIFPRSPLEGDGPCVVFRFVADLGGGGPENYYLVTGQTEPNYYPAYGLDPDEAFSLHLGTRFMLVLGVAQRDPLPDDEYDPSRDARSIVDRVAPEASLEEVRVAALLDVDGSLHAVLRCRIGREEAYIMGREAPPGFSRRVDLPPLVAYRLHVGSVLRVERAPE